MSPENMRETLHKLTMEKNLEDLATKIVTFKQLLHVFGSIAPGFREELQPIINEFAVLQMGALIKAVQLGEAEGLTRFEALELVKQVGVGPDFKQLMK